MANRYWRGGSGTWNTTSTTNWSTASGGLGGASVPTAADAVIIDAASGSPTVTLSGAPLNCLSITTTGATCTIAGLGIGLTISGNVTLSATTTWSASGTININATSTITTNAVSIGAPITFNAAGSTLTLGSALTSTFTFTFTAGTLSLGVGNYTLTCLSFSSTGGTRVIQFGTGSIATTSSGYNINGSALTFTGTSNLTMNSAQSTTLNVGFTSTNALSLTVSGTGTLSEGSGNVYRNFILTSFTGTLNNVARTLYGNFTVGSSTTLTAGTNATTLSLTGTQTITSNSKTLDFPLTQNGSAGTVALSGNLTLGTTRTYTQSAGTLSLAANTLSVGVYSCSSGNTPAVSLSAGGNIVITGNAATVLTLSSATNFNSVPISLSYSGATGTRAIAGASNPSSNPPVVTIPSGTDTVSLGSTASCFASLGLTGFGGTLIAGATTYAFNVTQNAATTVTIGTTGNGLILNAANSYTLTNGTLTIAVSSTFGSFVSSNTNTRQVNNNGGIILTGAGTIWNFSTTTNATYTTSGSNTLTFTNNTASARTFNGGGLTYGILIINAPASGSTLTFTGANTFGTTTMSSSVANTLVFPASTTTIFSSFAVTGGAGANATSITSSAFGTQATLSSPNTNSVINCSIQDSAGTGSGSWLAYTSNGNVDNGNNTGWVFTAPTTGKFLQLF
jgi:hypothetical protein